MDKLRFGVIGLGIMGQQYVKIYAGLATTEVTAVADINGQRAEEIGAKYGVAGRYTELPAHAGRGAARTRWWWPPPDFAHFEPARAVLESGRHLAVEKP